MRRRRDGGGGTAAIIGSPVQMETWLAVRLGTATEASPTESMVSSRGPGTPAAWMQGVFRGASSSLSFVVPVTAAAFRLRVKADGAFEASGGVLEVDVVEGVGNDEGHNDQVGSTSTLRLSCWPSMPRGATAGAPRNNSHQRAALDITRLP